MPGFAEDVSDAELRQQFDTNFFGAVAVTRAFLPQFERQGFGHIVMVSSISGRIGFPGVGSYAASKFALEGWTETLRFEMKPLGMQVVLVEPGAFETDIWTRNAIAVNGRRHWGQMRIRPRERGLRAGARRSKQPEGSGESAIGGGYFWLVFWRIRNRDCATAGRDGRVDGAVDACGVAVESV